MCREGRRGDRWERRRLSASAAPNGYLDWPGLGQVCCVERTRWCKGKETVERTRWRKGKETVERANAVTSLTQERADAARLLEICGHWVIEDRLRWVRDVVLGEGLCLVRTGWRRNCWRRSGTW